MLFLTEEINGFTCGGADVLKIIEFIDTLLSMVLFIIPMVLIVMVIVDFSKNVIAGKDDEMRKNVSIAIKRILFCAALFLINPIVTFFINFIGEQGDSYLKCIEIANSENAWQYKIDWDYYPYASEEYIELNKEKSGDKKGKKYVVYEYEKEDGTKGKIKIYEDGSSKKIS